MSLEEIAIPRVDIGFEKKFFMFDSRLNDPKTVDHSAVQAILDKGRTPTIQFSKPGYSPELLREVNRLCVELGDKLEVRFYGHYQDHFDASVLSHIPDVHWLSVNCLMNIVNESYLAKLPHLKRLFFGAYRLDKPDFLKGIDVAQLDQLALTENAKRNFDLAPLVNAKRLRLLYLEGHTRNIEVISSLPQLNELTLRALPKSKNLDFLCGSESLRSLELVLGGRVSIEEFHHASLENLKVVRVRGFESIGSLSRLPRLRRLQVEDQLQITSINLSGAKLRQVLLFNCKNLRHLEGLDSLDELAVFRVYRTSLDLDNLVERAWPSSLRVLGLYSTSQRWNDATRQKLDQRGYQEYEWLQDTPV